MPSPAAPSVTSITFDQTSYAPGAKITATVVYVPGTSATTQNFTGTAVDSATGLSGNLVVNFSVVSPDPTVASAADSGNRVWTKVSDANGTAVFTATA